MTQIAIVVPYYGAADALPDLHARISSALDETDWSLILVDDRSPDNGWLVIEQLCKQDDRVVGLRLSRNFGQHAAITAGLHQVDADWCVVMDCDLQDRPEDIPALLTEVQEKNADIAIARRKNANINKKRTLNSYLFNKIFSWASDLEVNEQIGNFRIVSRKVVTAYNQYGEQLRYFPGLLAQIGFQSIYVDLPRDERPLGGSSYTLSKLIRLAFESILSYSEKPLQMFAFIGLSITCLSGLGALIYFSLGLMGFFDVAGFASVIVLLLFFGGMLTFLISFVGLYASLIFREVRKRPIYLVDEALNCRQLSQFNSMTFRDVLQRSERLS